MFPIKGITGKVKDYMVYPLNSIRMVEGKPQCRLDSSTFMEEKLEISTNTGISMRCPSCNASLKGRPGNTVECPYCGSYSTLPQAYHEAPGQERRLPWNLFS